MHVVFICAEYPVDSRPTGGFGTYINHLSRALVAAGIQVTIICQGDQNRIQSAKLLTIIVLPPVGQTLIRFLLTLPFTTLTRIAYFLQYPLGFGLAAAKELLRLTKEQIDVIEGGDFGAELFFFLFLRKSKRPPVVIKLHTPSSLIRFYNREQNSLFYRLLDKAEKFCLKRADSVYSPTKALAKIVGDQTGLKILEVIPYPVSGIIKKKSNKRSEFTILYVGKLQQKKGVFVLIKAFLNVQIKIPQTKLIFVGPDTIENGVSVKAQLLKLLPPVFYSSIYFVGPISQIRLSNYYKKATVTVIPSLWENYPNVLLEAVEYGSPIIASRVGGIPEIVKNNREAILVNPDNSYALSKAIIDLLTHRKIQRQLVVLAQKRFHKKLNPSLIGKRTLIYYRNVCKENKVVIRAQ